MCFIWHTFTNHFNELTNNLNIYDLSTQESNRTQVGFSCTKKIPENFLPLGTNVLGFLAAVLAKLCFPWMLSCLTSRRSRLCVSALKSKWSSWLTPCPFYRSFLSLVWIHTYLGKCYIFTLNFDIWSKDH